MKLLLKTVLLLALHGGAHASLLHKATIYLIGQRKRDRQVTSTSVAQTHPSTSPSQPPV